MKHFLILSASLAICACGGASKEETLAPNPCSDNPCGAGGQDVGVDWTAWQSWTKVNAAPFVSKGHKKPWVNVYVPAPFAATYAALGDAEIPEGFAIVKSVHDDVDGAAGDVAMLTVMAKMDDDYDPDNGNWYYGVLSADGSKVMKEGKLEACMDCHSSGKDYLFGTR